MNEGRYYPIDCDCCGWGLTVMRSDGTLHLLWCRGTKEKAMNAVRELNSKHAGPPKPKVNCLRKASILALAALCVAATPIRSPKDADRVGRNRHRITFYLPPEPPTVAVPQARLVAPLPPAAPLPAVTNIMVRMEYMTTDGAPFQDAGFSFIGPSNFYTGRFYRVTASATSLVLEQSPTVNGPWSFHTSIPWSQGNTMPPGFFRAFVGLVP